MKGLQNCEEQRRGGETKVVPTKSKTAKAKFISIPKNIDINSLTEEKIEEIIKDNNRKQLAKKTPKKDQCPATIK